MNELPTPVPEVEITDYKAFLAEKSKLLTHEPSPVSKPFPPPLHKKVKRPLPKRSFRYHPASFAKLTGFSLERYLLDARLSPEAEAYVREALAKPSRHLTGFNSHTICYPAIRFDRVLKLESRNVEYAFALLLIYRPDVYLVLDQPPKIKVTYPGGWSEYTPDFLVITANGIEIWESRSAELLSAQCIEKPQLYTEKRGVYQAPLFQEHYQKLGFKYAIVTEHAIHARFCRAVEFLHPYMLGTPKQPFTSEEQALFVNHIRNHSGVRLSEVPIENATRRTELALYLLGTAQVFTNLSDADFTKPDELRIYATAQDEAAFYQYLQHARPRPANLEELGYRLKHGSLVEISGVDYKVTALSSTQVRLESEEGKILERSHRGLLDLKPRIGRIYNAEKTYELILQEAPIEHRLTQQVRKLRIEPYLPGGALHGERPVDHSVRRWLRLYEKAEALNLCGDEAIFPKFHESGRGKFKLPADVEADLTQLIEDHYLKPKASKAMWIWKLLLGKFGSSRLPSRDTILRRIKDGDPRKAAWKRGGKRMAEAFQSHHGDSPVWGSPHGNRSFEKAHIDSSPLDVRLNGEPGHYLAKMVDPFDGRILAFVITKDAPSELTIRELLLDCVRRHGALPSYISCDFGSEHRTSWLQQSLAALAIRLDIRPKSDPTKGGPVESAFSALCAELVHNLEGNTHLLKRARMITKACHPDQFAIWTSADIRETVEEYVSLRNDLPRSGKPSPNDIAAACYQKFGPPPRNMPTVDELQLLLLPFVERETRKVSKRGVIKANNKRYGIRGEQNILRRYAGKRLKVRVYPEDPNKIVVLLDSPRKSVHCVNLACSGPSQDIIDRANEISRDRDAEATAAGKPVLTPEERKAQHATEVVRKEEELKKRKTRKRRASRPTPDDTDSAESDENLTAIKVL